jgi:hypothetical protein
MIRLNATTLLVLRHKKERFAELQRLIRDIWSVSFQTALGAVDLVVLAWTEISITIDHDVVIRIGSGARRCCPSEALAVRSFPMGGCGSDFGDLFSRCFTVSLQDLSFLVDEFNYRS